MITGFVLPENQEEDVTACLGSLQIHAAEIILIDTKSTDEAVEFAREQLLNGDNAK